MHTKLLCIRFKWTLFYPALTFWWSSGAQGLCVDSRQPGLPIFSLSEEEKIQANQTVPSQLTIHVCASGINPKCKQSFLFCLSMSSVYKAVYSHPKVAIVYGWPYSLHPKQTGDEGMLGIQS